jgi:hypothetical protein
MRNIEKAMLVGAVSLLLSVCLHLTIVCEEFTGKVVGVADGDTITVMHQGWGTDQASRHRCT